MSNAERWFSPEMEISVSRYAASRRASRLEIMPKAVGSDWKEEYGGHASAGHGAVHLWEDQDSPATPFLRWAGGKRWLIRHLEQLKPKSFGRYFEPFLGSGAVLLSVRGGHPRFGSDTNQELISTFCAVRDVPETVIAHLESFGTQEQDFLACREEFNGRVKGADEELARLAALFVYLNKTSFNGLYRVNSSGGFNVPWGRRENPLAGVADQIRLASRKLNGTEGEDTRAEFDSVDYRSVLSEAAQQDWVFVDPPYVPVSKTAGFVGYTSEGFSDEDQVELRDLVAKAAARGVHVLLTNSDTPLARELYSGSEFRVREFPVFRAVGASVQSRANVKELVVVTYG